MPVTAEASGHAGELPARGAEPTDGLTGAAVCWSADWLPSPTAPFHVSGRYVAAAAFAAAAVRHSKVAKVDICVPLNGIDACRHQLQRVVNDMEGGTERRLGLFPESELPARLRSYTYDVLHEPFDVTRLSYVRSRFSDRVFPITATSMGLSYSFDLHQYFLRLLTAQLYPCDVVVCPTQAARSALEKRLLDIGDRYAPVWDRLRMPLPRFHLIPWGVDVEQFTLRDQALARRDLDLPAQRPIVLCVGRMRIQDKMDLTPLLLAFDRVCGTVKERPLLVLAGGSSEYTQRVLAHASQLGLGQDLHTFFGCPPACLPSLYAACDIFVAPTDSPSETFGLTIVEAMASGRPVVASDWDGYKELIVHGETGFRVRTDWADCLSEVNDLAPFLSWEHEHLHVGQSVSVDVPQLAHYLTQLIENPELRAQMGHRARERAEALYAWPIIIGQWEALWSELVAIARTIERKEPDRLEYLKPNYFQHFSHYPTRIIDEAVPVQLTPRGKEVLAGKAPLLLDPWAQGFLRPEFLHMILSALKPASWIRVGVPVGDVITVLHEKRALTQAEALMHLMWLAKYDLVAFGGVEAPR